MEMKSLYQEDALREQAARRGIRLMEDGSRIVSTPTWDDVLALFDEIDRLRATIAVASAAAVLGVARFTEEACVRQQGLAGMEDALHKIAAPRRPDGTYNLSREACEQIAREALDAD